MKLGVVVGTVVASRKDPSLEGVKLLLVQPVDEQRRPVGGPLVACDGVQEGYGAQAGYGDLVAFEGGREAALALADWFNPSDATVVAILDTVNVEEYVG
ncbi:MAG: EutN/CcmL family microcompartment protein [Spirochaetaceae bacterium]